MTGEETAERDFVGGDKVCSEIRRSIPEVGKETGGIGKMSKSWAFEKVKPATSQTPALWAVQVGRKRIGYVRKAARELYRAGRTPEDMDTIQGSRAEAARWLYQEEVRG